MVAGGPHEAPADEREREQSERRVGAQVKAWRAQGARVFPLLVKIACGADAKRRDMIGPAGEVLADAGAPAVQAIYAYQGPCALFDADAETSVGVDRAQLLASTYCDMTGRYQEATPANARALAEWGALVVDEAAPGGKHELAVRALAAALRLSRDRCDISMWTHLLPKLKEAAAHLPLSSHHDDVVGTHRMRARTERDRVVIEALGASADATPTLTNLYDAVDLPTKALVVAALERSGSAGAPAFAKVIDFMRLTRDDEMRVLAVRTLFAIDVVLARDDAERVAEVLGEWLPRVQSPSQGDRNERERNERERNVWAALGAEYAVRVLSRALARDGGERVRASLTRALGAPLERNVREVAAHALLEARKGTSSRVSSTTAAADDLQCARDTLSAPREPLPLHANSKGGFAPSWTPPASCARVR